MHFWLWGLIFPIFLSLGGLIATVWLAIWQHPDWGRGLSSYSVYYAIEDVLPFLNLAVALASIWMYFAVTTKRFHDRGKSGWWALLIFIPVVGQIWVLLECGFMEGANGDNAFGPQP